MKPPFGQGVQGLLGLFLVGCLVAFLDTFGAQIVFVLLLVAIAVAVNALINPERDAVNKKTLAELRSDRLHTILFILALSTLEILIILAWLK